MPEREVARLRVGLATLVIDLAEAGRQLLDAADELADRPGFVAVSQPLKEAGEILVSLAAPEIF